MINQDEKYITLYGRKQTGPQTWYTVTEDKLNGIVETMKVFCTILLGQQLNIYTE